MMEIVSDMGFNITDPNIHIGQGRETMWGGIPGPQVITDLEKTKKDSSFSPIVQFGMPEFIRRLRDGLE